MEEQRLRWTGEGLRFLGHSGSGEPIRIGGDEDGPDPRPSDLLPLSLAACTAYDVVVILRKQRQDLRGLEVITESEQDPDPPFTFRRISMRFLLRGAIDERKATRAIDLSHGKYCSVAATLAGTVAMDVSFEIEDDRSGDAGTERR